MLLACCLISCFGNINSMLLCRGFTYGIETTTFVFLSNTVTDSLSSAIRLLSGNVLFAKLIPANIEASMFAILTGVINFCQSFLAKQLGNFFNIWVGVTEDDMSQLWELFAIAASCTLIPIAFIWLVPSRSEVFKVQQINELLEKYPPKTKDEAVSHDSDNESEVDRSGLVDALMKLDPIVAQRMKIYAMYPEELGPDFQHPSYS